MKTISIPYTKVFDKLISTKQPIIVCVGGARSSKCLGYGTEVVMFSGYLKRVEDVQVGDILMGPDSKPRKVLKNHSSFGPLYKVVQSKGIDYIVNEHHILSLQRSVDAKHPQGGVTKVGTQRRPNGRYPYDGDIISIPIKEYLNKSKRWKRNFYGYRAGIEFRERAISIDPYYLGVWLGDGHKHVTTITTADSEIISFLYEYAASLGMRVHVYNKKANLAKGYCITNGNCTRRGQCRNQLHSLLSQYNLIRNKHIPDAYLFNTKENRLNLLAGLIDSDGHLANNGFTITQKDKHLADQIYYLAASLGFRTAIIKRKASIKSLSYSCDVYSVSIYGEVQSIPTKIERKKVPLNYHPFYNPLQSSIKVSPHGIGMFFGFTLDSDGLFLLKDFTVVHNSYSIAQLFIKRMVEEKDKNFLILRKTRPSLKLSAYKLFMDLLRKYEIYDRKNHNMSDLIYKHDTNYVVFTSIDDPEKIKSTEWNYIWLEEANEFTYDDFIVLKLRLSGKTDSMNQMILSKNPVDESGWIHQRLEKEPDVTVIRSTHKDNPFISDEYRKILYDLKETDLTFYKIYTLGEYAQLMNLIYTNWEIIEYVPERYDEVIYGLDFGYNNPNALVKVGIKDNEYYLTELLYQTHMTNQDLIEDLKILIQPQSNAIYADSAEPARIEEIARAGINIHAANKNVLDGIDHLKRHKLHIDQNSVNLINEISAYKYKEDRNGIVKEEPVKFRDHLLDSARYSIYTHYKQQKQEQQAPNYYIPDLTKIT